VSRADTLGIVGAGSFGSALASVVGRTGRRVVIWSRDPEVVAAIESERRSPRLPAAELPPSVIATTDPRKLAAEARLLVLAVASTDAARRAREVGQVVDGGHILIHAVGALAAPPTDERLRVGAGGVPAGSAGGAGLEPRWIDERISEILAAATPALRIGALAGPALPSDLAAGQFSSMVIASRFDEVITEARRLLNAPPALRVYTSHDVIGVELAAALSGALAIAVGLADALGVGPGPRAVLVTRGLAEASRLGQAAGGEARTFTGLAGLGNLMVRSAPAHREYAFGQALLAGARPERDWPEGARAAVAATRLAARLGVRTPVLGGLAAVITGTLSPKEAARLAADTVATEE
jgi:glycerol-3-phosphate dehydrogenase (NAD(P)+)